MSSHPRDFCVLKKTYCNLFGYSSLDAIAMTRPGNTGINNLEEALEVCSFVYRWPHRSPIGQDQSYPSVALDIVCVQMKYTEIGNHQVQNFHPIYAVSRYTRDRFVNLL